MRENRNWQRGRLLHRLKTNSGKTSSVALLPFLTSSVPVKKWLLSEQWRSRFRRSQWVKHTLSASINCYGAALTSESARAAASASNITAVSCTHASFCFDLTALLTSATVIIWKPCGFPCLSRDLFWCFFFSLVQLTWGTPAGKREECSFKGKNLEVRDIFFCLSLVLWGGGDYDGAVCWQTFPSVTNGFIKCASSLGNCSFFFFFFFYCLSVTLLSCQLLYLRATSLSNLCKSLVCVIQKAHQAKCRAILRGFPSSVWVEGNTFLFQLSSIYIYCSERFAYDYNSAYNAFKELSRQSYSVLRISHDFYGPDTLSICSPSRLIASIT